MTARASRWRLAASVLAAVIAAGCSSASAPRSEAVPQGDGSPLELGGRFSLWREVHAGQFEYWQDQQAGRVIEMPAAAHTSVTEPELDAHLSPTGDIEHKTWICPIAPTHNERLEFLDATGRVVHQVPVSSRESVLYYGDPNVFPDGTFGTASYKYLYSWCAVAAGREAYDSYRIVRDWTYDDGQRYTEVLLKRDASAHAPAVTISSPVPGQRFAREVSLAWSVSDADGDHLVSHVFYSADAGETYSWVLTERDTPTAAEPRGSRASLMAQVSQEFAGSRAGFESSERARFLVVVSDGMRWTAAESPDFTVAAHESP